MSFFERIFPGFDLRKGAGFEKKVLASNLNFADLSDCYERVCGR